MFKIAKFLWGLGKGGTGVAAVAGTGAAGYAAVDGVTTGGANVKSLLSGGMEMLGMSQADAGMDTGFFSFFKFIDKMLETYVGMAGRNGFTDWARTGLQRGMKLPEGQIELGSQAKPESLTNPATPGYVGGNDPTPETGVVETTTSETDAEVGETPVAEPDQTQGFTDIGSFFGNMKSEFNSMFKPRVVDGVEIEGETEIDWGVVGNGTANNLKAAFTGVSTGLGGIAGVSVDATNFLDNLTGLNWIADYEGSKAQDWSNGMKEASLSTQDVVMGGRVDLDNSAIATSVSLAAEFLPAAVGGPFGWGAKAATVGYQVSDPELRQAIGLNM